MALSAALCCFVSLCPRTSSTFTEHQVWPSTSVYVIHTLEMLLSWSGRLDPAWQVCPKAAAAGAAAGCMPALLSPRLGPASPLLPCDSLARWQHAHTMIHWHGQPMALGVELWQPSQPRQPCRHAGAAGFATGGILRLCLGLRPNPAGIQPQYASFTHLKGCWAVAVIRGQSAGTALLPTTSGHIGTLCGSFCSFVAL